MKEIGLYIHIPFCKSKCYYCDFISYSGKEDCLEKYINALKKEICERFKELEEFEDDVIIDTVYIGGGTPSIIDGKYIYDLLVMPEIRKRLKKEAEITIEVNPGTITEEKIEWYKKAGINRISIGLQSSDNNILKNIGRIHTYEEFLDCYNKIRKNGFDNVNVDLMLALPGQTIEILEDSLTKVISLNPEHISLYSLILEENTKLYELINEGKVILPEENTERNMYWKTKEILENNGYKHYEISNFAKQGRESKHNLHCWEQNEYLGFGAAAHSYFKNERYSNIPKVEEYINNIENNNSNANRIIHEHQTKEEQEKEYMMLGLRKISGVNFVKFENKFHEKAENIFKKEIEELINRDLIQLDNSILKLSNKGIDFANQVWEKFI